MQYKIEILVKWSPPYSNSEKYQSCKTEIEANLIINWLQSVGADAVLIKRTYTDTELSA